MDQVLGMSVLSLQALSLETAVGCACQCRDRCVRQGVTTQRTPVRQEEQRRMARRARRWRVHSAFTLKVNTPKLHLVRFPAAFPRGASGQLRFLGSAVSAFTGCHGCVLRGAPVFG